MVLLVDWCAAHWEWVLGWVIGGTVSAGICEIASIGALLIVIILWPLIWVYAITRAIFG